MTPLLRVLEDAPYFPSVADEAIRDLTETSEELDELVAGLDDANLRDVADDVRLLEAHVDAWRSSLDVDISAGDSDALVDAMDAQADATTEMTAPIDRLVADLGRCG